MSLIFILLSFFTFAEEKLLLTVLSPMDFIPREVIEEFQKLHPNTMVRFDFVINNATFERSFQNKRYDLVIADQTILENFLDKKLLLPLKRDALRDVGLEGLVEQKHTFEKNNKNEKIFYTSLIVNPLGTIHRSQEDLKPSWDWLIKPYPKWRQSIYYDLTAQELMVLSELITNADVDYNDQILPQDCAKWLKSFRLQKINNLTTIIQGFLSGQLKVKVGYGLEYYHLHRIIKNLKFALPKEGTIYRNIGVGILERTKNYREASQLASFLIQKKATIADYSGLLTTPPSKSKTIHQNLFHQKLIQKVQKIEDEEP